MKWPALWPTGLLALLIAGLDSHWVSSGSGHAFAEGLQWSTSQKVAMRYVKHLLLRDFAGRRLRNQVRALWYHGFDNYMRYGTCCQAHTFQEVLTGC